MIVNMRQIYEKKNSKQVEITETTNEQRLRHTPGRAIAGLRIDYVVITDVMMLTPKLQQALGRAAVLINSDRVKPITELNARLNKFLNDRTKLLQVFST